MTNNLITIELCSEDRTRIDNLIGALVANTAATEALLNKTPHTVAAPAETDDLTEALKKRLAQSPENGAGGEETTEPPRTQPKAEKPTQAEPAEPAPAKTEKPSVTKADIRAKVISLSQKNKRDAVKSIIFAYGEGVENIPVDKYAEVFEKLTALEVGADA